MGKMLGFLFALLLVAALAGPALAEAGCGGLQSVDTDTLITADGSSTSAPITPVPPKTEPEG